MAIVLDRGLAKIKEGHVLAAAKEWDREPGFRKFQVGKKYEVIVAEKAYPPKAIIALASYIAGGPDLYPKSFKGAKRGKYQSHLRDLGFTVRPKRKQAQSTLTVPKPISARKMKKDDAQRIDNLIDKHSPTEIARMVNTRLCQGRFRKKLLQRYCGKCAVTGADCESALVASHIVAWKQCKGTKTHMRCDPDNGLLLSANLDALFDVGLIGFNDEGRLVKAEALSAISAASLGVAPGMALQQALNAEQIKNLKEHRKIHELSDTAY